MKRICAILLAFLLTGCGGGGGRVTTGPMVTPEVAAPEKVEDELPSTKSNRLLFPFYKENVHDYVYIRNDYNQTVYSHFSISELPDQELADARHQPVYHDHQEHKRLFVGVDQGTDPSNAYMKDLPVIDERNGTEIRFGELDYGYSRDYVIEFLGQAINRDVVIRYTKAPDVRITGPSTLSDRNRLIAAVRLVNASLPTQYKMTVGPPLPRSAYDYDYDVTRDNTIHVQFNSKENAFAPRSAGVTFSYPYREDTSIEYDDYEITSSFIEINTDANVYNDDTDRRNVILMAHELIHALGLIGDRHVDWEKYASIMEAYWTIYETEDYYNENDEDIPQPRSLLYLIDRTAINALYSMEVNDSLDSLGPWSTKSMHIHGNSKDTGFGVNYRNGHAEPWAYGYMPPVDLRNNTALSGLVTWVGTLLGFTPNLQAVAGNASVSVNLSSLTGYADFTGIEYFRANTVWGDGDLNYSIAVRGNTFKQTGGDAGILTGIFVGQSHEGAAGTLERSDLTAAFGASR